MKLSIIIPVYNSATILHKLNNRILKSVEEMKLINDFELIMINDFSEDSSWEIIKELSQNNNYIKGISLDKNYGQHNAIMAGLNFCSGEKIITLDDDLQHPPEFFLIFWKN